MPREKKVQIIDELQAVIAECSTGVLTDYRGLTTAEITALRRALMKSDIKYRVVKNTLARFAAEKAGKNELVGLFEGPVAIAFGYGDVIEPAKALVEHIRTTKISLRITGGFFGDTVLTAEEVETLAKLPPREILLAQVLGGIQSPIVMLLSCLASPMRGFMGVLQARINQLEGE